MTILVAVGCHGGRAVISPEEILAPCQKLVYEVRPPVGFAEAYSHPLEPYALSAQMRWNSIVRSLSNHFSALCEQYNEGKIAGPALREWQARLLATVQDLEKEKGHLDAALQEYLAQKGALAAGPSEGEEGREQVAQARARMEAARSRAEQAITGGSQIVKALISP